MPDLETGEPVYVLLPGQTPIYGVEIPEDPTVVAVPVPGPKGKNPTRDELKVDFVTRSEYLATGGSGGPGGYVHNQLTPSSSWQIENPLGRAPSVCLIVDGKIVDADVEIDSSFTYVNVTFPSPTAGSAVLA